MHAKVQSSKTVLESLRPLCSLFLSPATSPIPHLTAAFIALSLNTVTCTLLNHIYMDFFTYPRSIYPPFLWHTPAQNCLIHGISLLFPLFTCKSAPRYPHMSPFSNFSAAEKCYYCWSERKKCFMLLPHYRNSADRLVTGQWVLTPFWSFFIV